jgi:hypothetical protein
VVASGAAVGLQSDSSCALAGVPAHLSSWHTGHAARVKVVVA